MKKVQILIICLILFIYHLVPMSGLNINPRVANSSAIPPVTTISINGSSQIKTVYYGPTTVTLSASDSGSGVALTQYSFDSGASWSTYSEPIVLDPGAIFTLSYRSKDLNDNWESAKEVSIKVKPDLYPPSSALQISGEIGDHSYFKSPIEIIIDAADDSSVAYSEYSLDEGNTWIRFENAITLTESNHYILYYRSVDTSGNIEKTKVEKINIDMDKPDSPYIVTNPADWTNDEVIVTIVDGTDEHSGTRKSQYRLSENDAWTDYSTPFGVSGNSGKIVYTRTIDYAGNISEISAHHLRIDNTPPTTPEIHISFDNWTNEPVLASILSGTDSESRVRKNEYKFGSSDEWAEYGSPLYIDQEGITQLYARTLDWAGNASGIAEAVIKIDYTAPGPPIFVKSAEDWTNQDVSVEIVHGPDVLSGPDISQYKLGEDGEWLDYETPIVISSEGIHLIFAQTYDRAANLGEISETLVKIDKTPPTSPKLTASTTEWTNQDVIIQLEDGTDELSGVLTSQYRIGAGTWTNYTGDIVISQEGITTVYARTLDVAGNSSLETSVTVKVDKTPPSAPPFLTYRTKTATTADLVWKEATDNIGVVQYGIYLNDQLIGATNETQFVASDLTPNQLQRIQVRAVDAAGNVSAPSHAIEFITSDPVIGALRDTFAIRPDGTAYAWGSNSYGILGDGTYSVRTSATRVPALDGFVSISPGGDHALGLKADGTAWAWGSNISGNLANPSLNHSFTPVRVNQLQDVVAVSSGLLYSLALKKDGTVWGWGQNLFGLPGSDRAVFSEVPIQVPIDSVVAISGSYYHSLALKNDGTVWAWGSNDFGELGNGTTNDSLLPTQVVNLQQVVAIAASVHMNLALKSDGTVWAWGNWKRGPIGDGTSTGSLVPVQVSGLSDIVEISAGYGHALALKKDGTVWAWGSNGSGQLGDGTTMSRLVPVQVSHLNSVTSIKAGEFFSLATRQDGTVWSWGENAYGYLGDGTTNSKITRVQVIGMGSNEIDNAPPTAPVLSITGVTSTTVVLEWTESEDNFGVSGYNVYQGSTLVAQTTVDSKPSIDARNVTITGLAPTTTYQFIVRARDYAENLSAESNIVQVTTTNSMPTKIVAAGSHTLALKDDGSVWGWGNNSTGQLSGYDYIKYYPEQVMNLSSVIDLASGIGHTIALRSDGTVWAWGSNISGQLGDGTGMDQISPVRVPDLSSVVAIAAGDYHSFAIKSDGTVWAWGSNSYGQLGLPDVYSQFTPARVTGLPSIKAVAAGHMHSFAITNNGQVYGWGANFFGQLGDGTTTNRQYPVLIPGLANIMEISAGLYHSLALRTDGTVLGWGMNGPGSIGDGTTTDRLSPVIVASGMAKISAGGTHSMALKTDGTVWLWGNGSSGQLGNGSNETKLAPVKETNITSLTDVSAGAEHSTAIQSDGRIWAWGKGSFGQLGNGNFYDSNVPMETQFGISGLMLNSIIPDNLPTLQEFEQEFIKTHSLELLDSLAPSVPVGFKSVRQNDGSVDLEWKEASDNFGVKGYILYMDNEKFDTVSGTRYRLPSSVKGVHVFTLTALDEAGNESLPSSPVIVVLH